MKNKNILWISLLLLVILCSISILAVKESAGTFEVEVKPINDKITIYGTAKFSITVKNNLDREDQFKLTFGDVTQWPIYYTEPFTDYMSGFSIPAGETYTTHAYFGPDKEIGKGYRNVYITVKSKAADKKMEFSMPVYMISLSSAEKKYLPNIGINIDFPKEVDPREEYELRVKLKNYNIKNISNLEIHVESDSINEYKLSSLGPEEDKTINIPIKLDPLHPPAKDTLKVKANTGPYVFNAKAYEFEIIDYSSEFDETGETSSVLFKKTKTTTYKNIGNTEKQDTISVVAPIWRSIFTSAYPKTYSVVRDEGIRYYSWDIKLKPMEDVKITIVTNYRIILYIILLILIIIVAYYIFRSPVQINKIAKNVELHKGVISEIKVMLSVRNISNAPLQHIKILDKIPNMANITQDFDIGTVKPSKVMKHESQGYTVVQWDIDELDPHEDRLITYRMKSKLSIFGNFELPRAKVNYKTKAGKKRVVRSNKLVIHS